MSQPFKRYRATRRFLVGETDVQIAKGQEVEFNGEIVKIRDLEITFPSLRSAITSGWLVEI